MQINRFKLWCFIHKRTWSLLRGLVIIYFLLNHRCRVSSHLLLRNTANEYLGSCRGQCHHFSKICTACIMPSLVVDSRVGVVHELAAIAVKVQTVT